MAIHRSPASLAHRRRLPTMATAPHRRKFESDDTALLREGLASLPSSRPSVSDCAHHPRPVEGGTVVTSPDSEDEEEDEEYDSPADEGEDDASLEEEESEFSSDGVPAEVAVSYDNDGPGREHDSDDEGSELEDTAVDSDDDSEEEEELTPEDLYATDDDGGIGSDRSLQDDDDDDASSVASASVASQHALFLPYASPSVESLKYDEDGDDDSSSDEDEDDDRTSHYSHRTYMIGRTGRPRMWDGCPSGVSVSSGSSSSSSDGSRASQASSQRKATKAAGVSFDPAVTVYPVFATSVYPPAMVESMYTGRDELKANKLRNKREFAYDGHDWRHAAEEGDMAPNADGELVHPVHGDGERSRSPSPPPPPLPAASSVGPCKTRNAVRTYAAAVGGYRAGGGGGTVHRAKRMRMYYP